MGQMKALVDWPMEACTLLRMKDKKRPTDVNQLAKMLVDMVTSPHEKPADKKLSTSKKTVKKASKPTATKLPSKKTASNNKM